MGGRERETSKDPRNALGAVAEEAAVRFLVQQGWTIVERNYNRGRGEVDIICEKPRRVLFVEVRSATTDYLESPAITVTPNKQSKVIRGARFYLQASGRDRWEIRFDVVAVRFGPGKPDIQWVQDAFRPEPSGQQQSYRW
jgi:putative endonuclease